MWETVPVGGKRGDDWPLVGRAAELHRLHDCVVGSGSPRVIIARPAEGVAPEPVTALWKDGIVERLDLVGLDARAIGQLLEAVLRGSVDRATTAHLAVRCQGNVLFLRELVLGALHDGSLCDDGGIWRLVAPLSPSERLIELVEARPGRLGPPGPRLPQLGSVGEPPGPAGGRGLAPPAVAGARRREGL